MTPVTPRAAPQRPAVARPEQQYRLVRKPTDPVAVEPIDAGRAAPWSTNGVGSSDAGHGLYLVVEAHELTAVPGAETSTAVRVRNTGSHVERAVVEVRGLPAGWVTVQPPELHLDVAAEGTAVVRFHPPRGPASGRGRMPLEFAVLSASNPTVRCIDGGTLTVEEFADVRAAVEPASVTSRGAATFAVTLENHGNRTVSRRVVATGGDQVRARVQPATVELAPGASVVLAVRSEERRVGKEC